MIAVVKDEEIQRIGYYAAIPATVLFNERLKPNEKLLYALITALSNKLDIICSYNSTIK